MKNSTNIQIDNSKTDSFMKFANEFFNEMNPRVTKENDFRTTITFNTTEDEERKVVNFFETFETEN